MSKILHFISGIDLSAGGPSRSMPSLCIGLNAIGVNCEVFAHTSSNPNDSQLLKAGIPLHLVPHPRTLYNKMFARNLLQGACLQGNVAHLQNIWDPALHWVARECQRSGTPYVVSPRGMLEPWSLRQKRWKKSLALSVYQLDDLRRAACVHTTAMSEMENVRALGVDTPIAVIPNAINTADYPAKTYPTDTSRRRRALFLSRIHPKKGIDLLLEAWDLLPTALTDDWELVIAGEGGGDYTLDDLRAMIAKRFAHLDVTVAGPQYGEAKTAMYHSADLFVLPTHSENFGMVIAEAMCCGVPVLTTTGTPWTVLRDEHLGWHIDLSVDNLRAALHEAMTLSDDARHDMGRRSREHILREYSIEVVSRRYKELYNWLAGEGPMPDCVHTATPSTPTLTEGGMPTVVQTITGLAASSGGPSTCTNDLLDALHAMGMPVTLITAKPRNPEERNMGEGMPWLHEVDNDYRGPLQYSPNFRKALEATDCDIYHCNAIWTYPNHITCATARRKHRPYVLSPHGMLYPTALAISRWKKLPALKLWFRKDILRATCLHATCRQEAIHCRAFGYRGPIAVIPNPVVIPPGVVAATSKPQGRRTIGFLGRLHPIKRVENILLAMTLLTDDERQGLRLEVMGSYNASYETFLKDEVRRLHLDDCVEFVGFVGGDEKYRRLSRLWALMVPSDQENFGMIVPEALICGTPVYASKGTPWQELNEWRCGWWDDNTPETIAKVMRQILAMDEQEAVAMGARGRTLIEQRYEQQSVARMMADLYRWIATGGTRPDFVV